MMDTSPPEPKKLKLRQCTEIRVVRVVVYFNGEGGGRKELALWQREDSCCVGVLESILGTVYSTWCRVYGDQCTSYCVQCTINRVEIKCTLYKVQYRKNTYSAQCTVQIIQIQCRVIPAGVESVIVVVRWLERGSAWD